MEKNKCPKCNRKIIKDYRGNFRCRHCGFENNLDKNAQFVEFSDFFENI